MIRVEPIPDRIPADSHHAETARDTSRPLDVGGVARETRATPERCEARHSRDRGPHETNTDTDPAAENELDASLASEVASLVALARRGDRGSWSTLYDLYAPVVHAVLLVRVGYPDADDLTQEVFIAAMRMIGSLRNDAMFSSWLLSIARRRAGTLFRIRTLFRRSLPHAAEGKPEHTDAPAIREWSLTPLQLLDAIRSLPAAYQETLALRLIEQLQGPEIARRLGLTHGSVRVNLTRGMKHLREKLAQFSPEHSP